MNDSGDDISVSEMSNLHPGAELSQTLRRTLHPLAGTTGAEPNDGVTNILNYPSATGIAQRFSSFNDSMLQPQSLQQEQPSQKAAAIIVDKSHEEIGTTERSDKVNINKLSLWYHQQQDLLAALATGAAMIPSNPTRSVFLDKSNKQISKSQFQHHKQQIQNRQQAEPELTTSSSTGHIGDYKETNTMVSSIGSEKYRKRKLVNQEENIEDEFDTIDDAKNYEIGSGNKNPNYRHLQPYRYYI